MVKNYIYTLCWYIQVVKLIYNSSPGNISVGGETLLSTAASRDVAVRLSGITFETMTGLTSLVDVIQKFAEIRSHSPTPILVYCRTGRLARYGWRCCMDLTVFFLVIRRLCNCFLRNKFHNYTTSNVRLTSMFRPPSVAFFRNWMFSDRWTFSSWRRPPMVVET